MSKRGYRFESETEQFFLDLTGQNRNDSILKANGGINRTFRVPGSGAMSALKGDVITAILWLEKQLKVECKQRHERNKKDGMIFFVEKEWIDKNTEEAIADNQIPILTLSFKGAQNDRVWVIIEDEFYFDIFKSKYNAELLQKDKHYEITKNGFKLIHKSIEGCNEKCMEIYDRTFVLLSRDTFKNLLIKVKEAVARNTNSL